MGFYLQMGAAIVARHVHLLTPQKLSNLSSLFHKLQVHKRPVVALWGGSGNR